MSGTVEHDVFDTLKANTLCPFAKNSKVWRGPDWRDSASYKANIERISDDFRQFCNVAFREKYHGYVCSIKIGKDARRLSGVKSGFFQFFRHMAEHDKSCANTFHGNYLDLDWQFKFAEMRMFLNVFAPCYPEVHSKYIPSEDSFYVFFQPEFSFDFCGVNPNRDDIKNSIRDSFKEAGMPYNGAQIDKRFEALLYIFPIQPFDPPVKWWEL